MMGGWKQLEEASDNEPCRLRDQAGFGFALTGARWLGSRVKLTFDVESSLHDTNLADVQANFVTFTFGIRGHFLERGPIRPYLRGSFGGSKTAIESVNGSGERLELSGMAAIMGAGLHLAPAKRLRFDLEINHSVIEYGDASVILDSVYVGTRINKAANATRIRFGTLFLL
ncbi:hypothetical protein H8E52_12760 [bacterium]|nr:hypothetical protein [bacterium]